MRPSGVHSRLSYEDEEVKWKLVKCRSQTYSELFRSDIPRPSSAKPSRPPGPSGVKLSRSSTLGPSQSSIMKPSREDLQARVEFLEKKKRSTKHKVLAASEDSHAARGKVLKLGASSSPSSAREHRPPGQFRVRGHPQHPIAEVSKTTGPQLRSFGVAVAKRPPGRIAEPPLDIVPPPSFLSGRLRERGGNISILRGMRTRCS